MCRPGGGPQPAPSTPRLWDSPQSRRQFSSSSLTDVSWLKTHDKIYSKEDKF